ncbi:MAG TPA: enolase C-terminal domain-like protein, partial [Gemmatales bacterium]|nr:enolase C-terminal domain-like protein [Gemmatales bacterium]
MLTQLHAHHIRIPLKKPIQHASHTRHETDNVLVACHLADGIVGYGEGVPRDYVTGETITSALQTLQKTNFESLQKPVQSFAEAIERIEHFRLYSPPGDDRQIASNAVRCALELAYLDAMGQHFQQPLSQITSLLAPEIHEPRARVQYSVAITSATGPKLAFQAVTRRWFGFRQCKVKVGIAGQDDVQRLRTIRRYMGPAVELRIDANEAWTVENARQKWEELAPVGLAWVEQPVSHEAIGELAKVRNQWKMPVMLD